MTVSREGSEKSDIYPPRRFIDPSLTERLRLGGFDPSGAGVLVSRPREGKHAEMTPNIEI